ncbi:MAG: precorrin-6A/cobalt-precorrin-6A reductase, partial [Pseudomonadota bacterium]|nr:precorrin-6A/cobalt-precorrin-6A reductase [Pseudomonadota bacterium]
MHILILGGTTEAGRLAGLLAARSDMRATLSLAGRTRHPVLPPIAHRIGGFGGPEGLAAWIQEHHVTALVDATHPFARIMPFNAAGR